MTKGVKSIAEAVSANVKREQVQRQESDCCADAVAALMSAESKARSHVRFASTLSQLEETVPIADDDERYSTSSSLADDSAPLNRPERGVGLRSIVIMLCINFLANIVFSIVIPVRCSARHAAVLSLYISRIFHSLRWRIVSSRFVRRRVFGTFCMPQ